MYSIKFTTTLPDSVGDKTKIAETVLVSAIRGILPFCLVTPERLFFYRCN